LEENGEPNHSAGPDSLNFANQHGFEVELFPNPTDDQMLAEATEEFMELESKAVYIQTMKGEYLTSRKSKKVLLS
jgi:uncharacterized protein YwqG